MHRPRVLEIAVASLDGARAAAGAGADRLELNSALELGGLTPSAGLLAAVKRAVSIPVIAMVRPRPGGFCYSPGEYETLLADLDWALGAGADGIAFGILDGRGGVDEERCAEVVRRAEGREVVFHRAFDRAEDPFEALEALIGLGVARVMTSGREAAAGEGKDLIRGLRERARGRIEILPAGGLTPEMLPGFLEWTGCDQAHASARGEGVDPTGGLNPKVRFQSPPPSSEAIVAATDPGRVAAFRRAIEETAPGHA